MVRGWLVLALVGCSFSRGAAPLGAGDGSAVDTMSNDCTPAATACEGRVARTCGADHHWDPAKDHTCDYTCGDGACVVSSNIGVSAVGACGPQAPALTPSANAQIVITSSSGTHIDCTPDCGTAGVTRIDPTDTITSQSPSLAWFCLSALSLPATATLTVPGSGGPAAAIGFVVDGAVSIDGDISFDGGSATSATTGGVGAPGGFDGSALSSGHGGTGKGPCPGGGGDNQGSGNHWVGGGGGGGGYATAGAAGGNGECSQSNHFANGSAGGPTCGNDTLIPLIGGSGGGGGGDATTNVQQGWAAGGGGGALQISSRISIAIAGGVHARGGNGYGENSIDGGGGGGAGGALLLEAPMVTITGTVSVDGGAGGSSGSGPGGAGGTGAAPAATGPSHSAPGQGGGGGGGAAGKIRINAVGAMCPAASSCSTGPLMPQ